MILKNMKITIKISVTLIILMQMLIRKSVASKNTIIRNKISISTSSSTTVQPESSTSSSSIRFPQCHNSCIKKFATDDISCLQAPECSTCWDECTSSTSINKSILATWTLTVTSMTRENSLVTTNIAWHHLNNSPNDCLVTWEVSGGGLIGNLLTQTSSVELSLWPDTKYRIQVTCKNKQSEEISRSLPLTLDTGNAMQLPRVVSLSPVSPSSTSPSKNHFNNDLEMMDEIIHDRSYFLNDPTETSSLLRFYKFNKEFVLGTIGAILLFIIILIAFMVSKRKSRALDKMPLVDEESVVPIDDVERLTIHV